MKDQVPDEKTNAFRQLGLEVPESEIERDGLQGEVAKSVLRRACACACMEPLRSFAAGAIDRIICATGDKALLVRRKPLRDRCDT